jgi:hypothetical protein
MIRNRQTEGESNAQKLVKFLNEELRFKPERCNKALDVLREALPQVMWDIPEEQDIRSNDLVTMRPETSNEHIARDMQDGRFPKRSIRQMVPFRPEARKS